MNTNDLVSNYVKLRDHKKELQEKHKAELRPINDLMDEIESAMLKHFAETGATSSQTPSGTVYQSLRETFTVEDPLLFREFVASQDNLSYFESRASKELVSEYLLETGALPPGIKYSSEITIGVRRK